MSINGLTFILFLLVFVAIYYLIPRRGRWIVLLFASVVFYLSYVSAATYLLITIVMTYLFALWLEKLASYKPDAQTRQERLQQKKRNDRKKRAVLTLALLLDLSSLVVLKYSAFLVGLLNHLIPVSMPIPSFLLPLGISFYVFQTSGYLIDIYRGKHGAEHNLAKYALFVGYFPQMLQGPINRYTAMKQSLFEGSAFDWTNIQHGFFRIIYGVLKKALIADPLMPIVTEIYTNFDQYPGAVAFFGAALYCLQLYCDFSGGIDVVCGASILFGVRMQENFCQPYFATSLSDFWRRWHISLGEWMKDYLFYPLALSKRVNKLSKVLRSHLPNEIAKRLVPCIATFVVFLAVGVWQGPGLANVAYGLWNGFWMSVGVLWVPMGAKLDQRFSYRSHKAFMTVFGCLRTNLLVIIGRYFSNAATLTMALRMLRHTVAAPGFTMLNLQLFANLGFSSQMLCTLVIALAAVLAVSIAKERQVDVTDWICNQKWYIQFAIVFLSLLTIVFCVYANTDYVPIAYVYENV